MLLFYFLLPILAVTSVNCWKCNPKDTVIPQLNGTLSFPLSDQTLPYSKNMNCTWTIRNIPKSYVVRIDITANFAASDRFSIVSRTGYRHDFNGATNDIPQLFTNSLYFPEGELEIVLISGNSNSDGFLTFTLEKQHTDLNNYYPVYLPNSQEFIQSIDTYDFKFGYAYGIESKFEYVLRLVAASDSINYASCLIYAVSPNKNDIKFLTGFDTQIEGVPKRFIGLTVFQCFSNDAHSIDILIARLPSSIHPQSTWTVKAGKYINYTLTSNNKYPSYLTTTGYYDYSYNYPNDVLYAINSESNNKNTKLELYCGSLAPVAVGESRSMQFLEEIPVAESDTYLPQKLCRDWNSYAFTGGSVRLDIRRDGSINEWNTLTPGRKGFVVTDHFGFQKSSTTTDVTFRSVSNTPKDSLLFSYTMENRNMQMDSAVVSVRNSGQLISNDTLFGSFYAGQNYSALGTSMRIQTIRPSTDSYGALIFFEVAKTASQGCLLIAICMSWAFAM